MSSVPVCPTCCAEPLVTTHAIETNKTEDNDVFLKRGIDITIQLQVLTMHTSPSLFYMLQSINKRSHEIFALQSFCFCKSVIPWHIQEIIDFKEAETLAKEPK